MKFSVNRNELHELSEHSKADEKKQKFEGFDFLRAVFLLAVIAYKTKVFHIPEILVPNSFTKDLSAYVLSGMVGALAVPVFLQISLFLFYYKSENAGVKYFVQKRFPKLLLLYVFWVSSITVFETLFIGKPAFLAEIISSPKTVMQFIVSGNNTPYFFFFSLIFVTILAETLVLLLRRIASSATKIKISYSLLFASSTLIFAFSTIEPIIRHTDIQLSFLNTLNNLANWDYTPLNFLPYVFTAAIVAQEYREGKLKEMTKWLRRKVASLFFLTLLFFALEWSLTSKGWLIQVDQDPLDHYLRLSLVFGSWLLLYLSLIAKYSAPEIVKFISKCSLGIYGFHVFFIFKRPYAPNPTLDVEAVPLIGSIFQAFPILGIITTFLSVLAGSIVLTLIFKKVKHLRDLV